MTNDITTFHLTPDFDLWEWINVIQILYNDLCDLDSEAMSDLAFMLLILGNISASSKWQEFGSHLRKCLGEYDNHQLIPTPITSTDFIVRIHEEHWFCSKNNAQAAAEALSFTARTSED